MEYEDQEDDLSVDEELVETEEEGVVIDDESPNIVADLKASQEGRDILKDIAKQVCEDFEEADESSEEFRDRVAQNYKLYTGFLPPKDLPFKDCANIHIPIYLEGVSRLEARTYAEVFLTGDSLIVAMPVGPDEQASMEAMMVTKHMDWQFTEKILDFRRQMQRGIHMFFNVGDFICISYYDELRRCNRHEVLSVDDVRIPYTHVSTMPDLSDVPYKIRILRYRKPELLDMKSLGWEDVDKIIDRAPPGYDDDPQDKLRESIAEVEGELAPDGSKRNGEYKLYEYHGKFQFPGEDRARPILAVVDSRTKIVTRLYIREEYDWQDRIRFERQVAEKEQYMQLLQQYQQDMMEYPQAQMEYEQYSQERQMMTQVLDSQLDQMEKQAVSIGLSKDDPGPPPVPVEPTPPGWMQMLPGEDGVTMVPSEPEPPLKVPMEMFSHAICMENVLGVHGLSPGQMHADWNRAANNLYNQMSDQATLANTGTYLASDLVDFEAGDFEIGPGVINRLTGISPEMVEKAMVPLRPPQGNPQLGEMSERIYNWSQTAFGATAALSGEPGKSGETYRGFNSRVEQALKQLSVSAKKFTEGLEQVAKNNGKLNSMYLPDEEIVYISSDLQKGMEQVRVTRKMYQQNYRIKIRADMRFASQQQRVAEADQLLAMPQAVPPLMGNLAFWYAAVEEKLKAQGSTKLLATLGPRPPEPTTPLGVPPPPPPMPPGMQQGPPNGQPNGQKPQQPPQPPGIPGPVVQ